MSTATLNAKLQTALANAVIAVQELDKIGTAVVAQLWSNDRAILIVAKPPESIKGAVRCRVANGNVVTRTWGAPFHGAQLEWSDSVPMCREAGHA